jgi:hypothetical protein
VARRNIALARRAATPRALALGVAASVFVNLASPHTESTGFSNFSWSYLPEGGVFVLLFLLVANAGVRRLRPRWALTVPELLLVFVMALAANCTSIFLMYFLCSAIISPHYFASAENRWDQDLIPHLKPWLIVSNDRGAAHWFYEGLPATQHIPWRDWATPLAAWMPFLVALLVASFAMMALLRRQWLEHEKLSYPLMRLPLELVDRGVQSRKLGPLTRAPSFWVGALIPFTFGLLDLIHGLTPACPSITIDHLGSLFFGIVRPGPHFPDININLNFLALGSGFFVPTDVLFGIWSLYLLFKLVQEPIIDRLGIGAAGGGMFVWGPASTSWQSFGAFTLMVAGVIHSARRRLAGIFDADGANAAPERPALYAMAASVAVMGGWLYLTGLPLGIVPVFVTLVLVIYLGVARVVCQTGVFYIVPPMIAQNPIIYALGASAIGRQGMISLALTYAWHGDVQTVMAGLASEAMKVEEQAPFARGELSLAMLGSAIIGLVVAPIGIILSAYPKGALTWNTWVYKGWGPNTYGQVLGQLAVGQKRDWFNAMYYGMGFVGMLFLTAMRNRYAWWPVHPIGLAVVSSFTMYAVYLPFLIAWVTKTAILRWGGYRTYHAATPFFVGLGVGHYLARAVALIGYGAFGLKWKV